MNSFADKQPTIIVERSYKLGDLDQRVGKKITSREDTRRKRTLFECIAVLREAKLSGFMSFAQTNTPFLPAGTAKGPMPAMTSHTTSPGLKRLMSLVCSASSLLFQYTLA